MMARNTPAYVTLREDLTASLRYQGIAQPGRVAEEMLRDMEVKGYVVTNKAGEVANGKA